MAVQHSIKSSEGLIFDAEDLSLSTAFGDEISAYRARRTWMEVLGSFFLLERDRDYDLEVARLEDESCFILICTFGSACGRYAFWRLINKQAPEAEKRLGGNPNLSRKSLLNSIFGGTEANISHANHERQKASWASKLFSDTFRRLNTFL